MRLVEPVADQRVGSYMGQLIAYDFASMGRTLRPVFLVSLTIGIIVIYLFCGCLQTAHMIQTWWNVATPEYGLIAGLSEYLFATMFLIMVPVGLGFVAGISVLPLIVLPFIVYHLAARTGLQDYPAHLQPVALGRSIVSRIVICCAWLAISVLLAVFLFCVAFLAIWVVVLMNPHGALFS
jgi:hypothetical protein